MALSGRFLFWISFTVGLWAFSFGVGSQMVSHWLNEYGLSDTIIGLCHSFYYFGMAAGSCVVPFLARRLHPIATVVIGLLISSATLAIFPATDDAWLWYVLRFINGCGGAWCVVPLETIVSRDSSPEKKTRNFAFYGVALTLGGALGFVLAPQIYVFGYVESFAFGASIPGVAAFLCAVGMARYPHSVEPAESRVPLRPWENFLSFGTAWCQGFLEAPLVAFLPLYLESRGFETQEAGLLLGITTVGVIVFQIPVAWLSDRFGKVRVLVGCYLVVALGLGVIPFVVYLPFLAIVLFTFGACTGAMYPLGLSLLGDRMPASALTRAYAWYLVIECVGSQVGAAATGQARDWWGEASMFYVSLAIVFAVLAVWLVQRSQATQPASLPTSR